MLTFYNLIILIALVLVNGGRYDWAYQWTAWLLWLNLVPLAYIILRDKELRSGKKVLVWGIGVILPWTAFAVLFALSLQNPSLLPVENHLFSPLEWQEYREWLPTTANPERGLYFLRLYLGLLVMFAAVIVVPTSRTWIRRSVLLLFLTGALLAIVGGLMKLTGTGKMFWLFELREPIAYATMFYKNQWAYFALLCASAGCGWFHYTLGKERLTRHFPEKSLAIGLLVLMCLVSIPLAQARGASVLAFVLFLVFISSVSRRLIRSSWKIRLLFVLFVAAGSVYAVTQVAAPQLRTAKINTERQIEAYKEKDFTQVKRLALYRDTWAMIGERPVWGWGIGSFIHIHPIFAGPEFYQPNADLPVAYEFAHCDYLEMLAEMGIVGTTLLLLPIVILILHSRRHGVWKNQFSPWLGFGSALVAIAATFDMVFSNPAIAVGTLLCAAMAIRYAFETARIAKGRA